MISEMSDCHRSPDLRVFFSDEDFCQPSLGEIGPAARAEPWEYNVFLSYESLETSYTSTSNA